MKQLKLFLFFSFLFIFCGTAAGQTAIVKSENANLRGTPGMTGKIVDTVAKDTKLEVFKQKGTWFLVQSPDFAGWIHGDTIMLIDAAGEEEMIIESTDEEKAKISPPSNDSKTLVKGARGGCYYVNSSGRKVYVDRDKCN